MKLLTILPSILYFLGAIFLGLTLFGIGCIFWVRNKIEYLIRRIRKRFINTQQAKKYQKEQYISARKYKHEQTCQQVEAIVGGMNHGSYGTIS